MWKDPLKMEKWLLHPSDDERVIIMDELMNVIHFNISSQEYNDIQNQAQMIFCSANNWPAYCIIYLVLKKEGKDEKEIIDTLRMKYSD
tara:strand:+ start:321 stop:584 length:264 start_codon:yes stop_codon:yes gene_type:complete